MPRFTLLAAVLCSAVLVVRYPPTDSFAAFERARVRAHLDSAERELRAEPVTGLTTSQHAARARALGRLREYWVRGVFPQNTDFPNERVPYFLDRYGTRCAMAYLIEQSGHGAFVARVAATRNNARIRDLRSDPQLVAWLDENGMTLEEAARIQPNYCLTDIRKRECDDPDSYTASTGYKTTIGMSIVADVVSVALNSAPTALPRTISGGLGLATGALGIMIGAPSFDQTGALRAWGFFSAGMGAVSAAFGVYRLSVRRSSNTPMSFAAWLSASGASGLSGRITF
jgi:hypothetical protein